MITVKLEGVDRINKRLELIKGKCKDITPVLLTAGYQLEAEAKNLCLVKTGRLRSSIRTRKEAVNSVIVGTPVEYSEIVEHRKPYMRPAFESVRPSLLRAIEKELMS